MDAVGGTRPDAPVRVEPETWYDRATLPTLGQILRDQLALADSVEATDRWLDDEYKQTMW